MSSGNLNLLNIAFCRDAEGVLRYSARPVTVSFAEDEPFLILQVYKDSDIMSSITVITVRILQCESRKRQKGTASTHQSRPDGAWGRRSEIPPGEESVRPRGGGCRSVIGGVADRIQSVWSVFSKVAAALDERGLLTEPRLFGRLERKLAKMAHPPFEFCVVDEAQDIGVAELRFLAALGAGRPDALFFAGDLGQRIFQTPFSWRALGVDIRGRSHTLRVNYRTCHQIRRQADRLQPPETSDVDGNTDRRTGTVSVFNGTEPVIQVLPSHDAETAAIAEWLKSRGQEGYAPHEMGVFVRSKAELDRAIAAVEAAGYSAVDLAQHAGGVSGKVAVGTMHLAKGLEFRAVVVAACDDEVLPLQARIERVGEQGELDEVYTTERHLLYVACTRARDHLLVTGVEPASEFLDDLLARPSPA